MDRTEIEGFLAQSLADRKLSGGERQALAGWLAEHAKTDQKKGEIRHAACELARSAIADPDASRAMEWLEDVMKAVVPIREAATDDGRVTRDDTAYFSPGEDCLNRIIHRFQKVQRSADLCVFTITDDRISRTILDAHRRGVKLRIISDAAKANDLGSDMEQFHQCGIAVKLIRAVSADLRSDGHMHHKFAIFDGLRLINGSYNWTRGAANVNYENLIDTMDACLLKRFIAEFERLWNRPA